MKVTIYEVAEEAGLSIATVSRYINKKGGISPKSEAKIVDAIQKLHYVPAASAQSLALGLSGTVGIQMGKQTMESHYFHQFLSGVSKAVMKEGFDLLLTQLEGDNFSTCNSILTRKKMDGIIFPGATPKEVEYMKLLGEKEFPFCYAGARFEWDQEGKNVYGGYTAYRRDIMELLIRKGCKKILWLELYKTSLKRTEDIIRKSSSPEVFLPLIATEDMSTDEIYRMLFEKFQAEEHPDGIFFENQEIAGFVYAVAGAAGLRIPDDIKMISLIHSKQQNNLFTPNLSVVYLDAYQMGYQAGQKICAQIQKNTMDPAWDMVSYEIWENETL